MYKCDWCVLYLSSFSLSGFWSQVFIVQLCPGVYHLLLLVYRVLDNISLVEHKMTGVGVARIVVPILTPSALWKRSGEAT